MIQRKPLIPTFATYFFRGLLIIVPAAATIYVLISALGWIDRLIDVEGRFGFRLPGLGVLAVAVLLTALGFVASNILTSYFIDLAEGVFRRLPLVRILYTSIKDLVEAFVGEKKRFDHPVVVSLFPDSEIKAIGFITRRSLAAFDLPDHVAVYFPNSFAFAGRLVVMPRERAVPLKADRTTAMAFIVSGGVSGEESGAPPGGRSIGEKV